LTIVLILVLVLHVVSRRNNVGFGLDYTVVYLLD